MAQDTIGSVNAIVSEDPNMLRYAIPYKEYIVYLQEQNKNSDSLLHLRENELNKCQEEVRELDKNLAAKSILPYLTNTYGVIIVGIIALVVLLIINKRNIKFGKGDINVSIEKSKEDNDK